MGAVAGAIAESSPAEALQLLTQHNKTPQSNKHSATQPATRCQAPRAKAEHITTLERKVASSNQTTKLCLPIKPVSTKS